MPKISALPAAGTLADDDITPFTDDSAVTTKKFTLAGLLVWLQSKTIWITTAMIAAGAVTTAKKTAITEKGNMTGISVTTSYQNAASQVLPAVSAAHKYLIVCSFTINHGGGTTARDYTCAIRNGTTALQTSIVSTISGTATYFYNVNVSYIHTSSASGGETINFSIIRNSDNGGAINTASHYSIVDLGRA